MSLYIQIFKLGVKNMLISKLSMFVWTIIVILPTTLSIIIWLNILGEKQSIGGFNKNDFLVYYLLTGLSWYIIYGSIKHMIKRNIRNGSLNQLLIRPYNPLLSFTLIEQSWKYVSLIFAVPITLFFAYAFQLDLSNIQIYPIKILVIILHIIFANCIWILMEYILGSIAFFVEETWGIESIFEALLVVFGGFLIPFELLPEFIKQISILTPYQYLLPKLMSYVLDRDTNFLIGLIIQVIWIGILYLVYKYIWNKGLKRYSAYGG